MTSRPDPDLMVDDDTRRMLATLWAERAIERALVTYCRAIDRCDAELLRSIYHDDAWDDHGDGYRGGPDGYVAWVMEHLRTHFTRSMHTLHNVSIDLDGDSARVESVCIAHHVRPGDDGPVMDTFACRYLDRFEHRPAAGWRIATRVVVSEWRLRQPTLADHELPPGFAVPARDRTDLSYASELPRRAPS